jgi:hypothetical protein
MRWTAALLASLPLPGGCAGTGAGTDPRGPWRPILTSRDDAPTDGTARAVLAHNLTGRRLCGW